jgi:hypothetical protein
MDIDRPVQHEINQKAKRVFEHSLPIPWIPREERPDYFIDYRVQIVRDKKLTGLEFRVQLKGKKSARAKRGKVSFSVERKHLVFWMDKCRLPVFLVVVDTQGGRGWWLFVQKYVLHELAGKSWRTQETTALALPESQVLGDNDAIEMAVTEADKFMAGMRPAAIEAAADAERRRWESLDPRLDVEVSLEASRKTVTFCPREPVNFGLRILEHAGDARRRVEEAQARGLTVTCAAVSLSSRVRRYSTRPPKRE